MIGSITESGFAVPPDQNASQTLHLNLGQRPAIPGEGFRLDAKPLEDRNEELSEWQLLIFYFASPSNITHDSRAGLIVVVSFTKLEISAIGEAKVLATGRNYRVVAREVETARSGAMHR